MVFSGIATGDFLKDAEMVTIHSQLDGCQSSCRI